MELILPLSTVRQDDVTRAGSKVVNLSLLAGASFSVPPAFVLLTTAYDLFVETNAFQARIDQMIASSSNDDLSSLQQASDAIGALFARGMMPDIITEAATAAYQQVGVRAVAVRSSATTEDLPGASFAGLHETFLNVSSPEALMIAIRRCWSSIWSARALDYRARQSIRPASMSMAVIIQELVLASVAGVLFTNNPISGAGNEAIINASWGLGEAIVQGTVTPDTFIIDKTTGQIKQMIPGDKVLQTVPDADGVTNQAVALTQRQQTALSQQEVADLLRLGCEIEQLFQSPQDIEWAIADETIFVLQARPVTTKEQKKPRRQEEYAVPGDDSWGRENEPEPQPFDLWTRTNMGENLPFPVTPLSATAFAAIFLPQPSTAEEQLLLEERPAPALGKRLYGRVYVNEGAVLHTYNEFGLPTSFSDATWGSNSRAYGLASDFHPMRLLKRLPSAISQQIKQARQKPKQPKQQKKRSPRLTDKQIMALIDQWLSDFLRQDLDQLDDRALWLLSIPLARERARTLVRVFIAAILAAISFYFLAQRVNKWTGDKTIAPKLVMALSGIQTAEIGPALWHMAQILRASGLASLVQQNPAVEALQLLQEAPEANLFKEQFNDFLNTYGTRCANDAEFFNPRWRDNPAQVIALIAEYLRANDQINPLEAIRHQTQEREEVTTRLDTALNPFRRIIFRWLLKTAQRYVRLRDNYRSYVTKFLYPTRAIVAELGKRWTARGWLSKSEDIFFLMTHEISKIIASGDPNVLQSDLREITTSRRAAFDFWYYVTPPEAVGPEGEPVFAHITDGDSLQGLPASAGIVRGTARVVHSVQEAMRLQPGDILVTQATDPGWTPIFPLVSGLVLETGGLLSHGAIIAREYAIPAVINVPGAIRQIRDGQTIVVDGSNGRVYVDETTMAAV